MTSETAGDMPDFKFIAFNPRRFSRGAEACRVEVDGEWLWMSRHDIAMNIETFGEHPELLKARDAYKYRKAIP